MSKANGFARMDVSTSIHEDMKFRRIARIAPESVAPCFTAYLTLMAESWREGKRLPIEDAWPVLMPWDATVVELLKGVRLIDPEGRIPERQWGEWFVEVHRRREVYREGHRERQRRYVLRLRGQQKQQGDRA